MLWLTACAESPQTQKTSKSAQISKGEAMILTGDIAMRGSSRTRFLSITEAGSGIQYKILNPQAYNLDSKQNHTLTLKVKLHKAAIGAGFPAEIEVLEIFSN